MMQTLTLWALACLATTQAQMQLTFSKIPRLNIDDGAHVRRDSELSIHNVKSQYMINITVGTPPQSLALLLDPGATTTFVPNQESCRGRTYSSSRTNICPSGSFNNDNSSTYEKVADDADYSSSDQYISGVMFQDKFVLDGIDISNATLGLADSIDVGLGTLGLGRNSTRYANIPDLLVNQGKMKTKAYSISMNGPDSDSGSVLFGAVDKSKYTGKLTRTPFSTSSGDPRLYLSEVIAPGGQNLSRWDLPAIAAYLITEPISVLPDSIVSRLGQTVNTTYQRGYHYISCSASSNTDKISLRLVDFDGPVLEAQIGDLVIPKNQYDDGSVSSSRSSSNGSYYDSEDSLVYDDTDTAATTPSADGDLCLFAVQNGTRYSQFTSSSSSYTTWKIGSALLRRTYSVFDIVNNELAVALMDFSSDKTRRKREDLARFESYGAVTPGADLHCGSVYSAMVSSSQECRDRSGTNGGRGSGSRGGSSDTADSRGGLHGMAAVGLGIGMGVLGLLIAVLLTLFLTRKGFCGGRKKGAELEKGTAVEDNPTAALTGSAPAAAVAAEEEGEAEVRREEPAAAADSQDDAALRRSLDVPVTPVTPVSPETSRPPTAPAPHAR